MYAPWLSCGHGTGVGDDTVLLAATIKGLGTPEAAAAMVARAELLGGDAQWADAASMARLSFEDRSRIARRSAIEVRKVWLSRQDLSPEELDEAYANERRTKLLVLIAQHARASQELLSKLAASDRLPVAIAVVGRSQVPDDAVLAAVATIDKAVARALDAKQSPPSIKVRCLGPSGHLVGQVIEKVTTLTTARALELLSLKPIEPSDLDRLVALVCSKWHEEPHRNALELGNLARRGDLTSTSREMLLAYCRRMAAEGYYGLDEPIRLLSEPTSPTGLAEVGAEAIDMAMTTRLSNEAIAELIKNPLLTARQKLKLYGTLEFGTAIAMAPEDPLAYIAAIPKEPGAVAAALLAHDNPVALVRAMSDATASLPRERVAVETLLLTSAYSNWDILQQLPVGLLRNRPSSGDQALAVTVAAVHSSAGAPGLEVFWAMVGTFMGTVGQLVEVCCALV